MMNAACILLSITLAAAGNAAASESSRGPTRLAHWSGCLVLPYAAFGPQVMAYETIGYDWYRWNPVGPCEPDAPRDDVRVVVFRNITLADAERQYSVVVRTHDYRYLEYGAALDYLKHGAQQASDFDLPDLADDLRATRKLIVDELGP